MATKQRHQNPVSGDTVQLRLFTFNANNPANPYRMGDVNIYYLDPTERSERNHDGRRLVQTIPAANIVSVDTGHHMVEVAVEDPLYVIGKYVDDWTVTYNDGQPEQHEENSWEVYSKLWYSSPIPIVYDFDFDFRPNRMRCGSKRFLDIDVVPNVPRCSDLQRYYANLAIASPLQISIAMNCVECMPCEEDLRTIVDCEPVPLCDKGRAFYFLDTEALDMKPGIYDVWFTMLFGASTYISERNQLQMF